MSRALSISMAALLLAIIALAALETWVDVQTRHAQQAITAGEEADFVLVRTSPR